MTQLVGLHHVSLTVSDLDRSVRWYREVLGMEVVFEERGDARNAAVMRLPGTGSVFAVVQHHGGDGTSFDPTRIGLDHVAFTVAEQSDMDAWSARLAEHGVDADGPIDVPPGAILNFKDPDGIAVSIFWDR